LIALVVALYVYVISQEILIKRLRRQLAEKRATPTFFAIWHGRPLTVCNRRFAEQRLAAEVLARSARGIR